ncbi:DNA polymerase I [Aerococcus urinaehominis]|uniref:DNA polymerase I n=1 Tax=Aerococcus urinaehominis TaxID=128944 RepID=A0A120IAZ2_9LACT|nr:DNA polymerase I [Aerococcus urinaehominis]AMB99608.1 DNA polymerase I [Aerococcus urinaehominis]SDL87274.1 DNA polymerase I [Aerococcus urinaehominis]
MSKKKLLLFDGSSLAFRAFYAIRNVEGFINKNGLHTNALYGFHTMLTKILKDEQASHILVAFDAGKTTFRTDLYQEYKGGRQSAPDEFREQMPFFPKMLDALGIKHYQLANYEADDIIGTLARLGEEAGFEVVVVSGDRDLIQLARDHTRVDITKKGVSVLESYTPETITESMAISPEQLIDVKGLMGDSSDNYPGVTGVGEKTALKLVQEYGSIENLYDNIDELKKSKRKENLIREKDQAFLSKRLATIDRNSPLTISLEDTTYQGYDLDELMAFYKDMSFNKFLTDLLADSDQAEALAETQASWQEVKYHRYESGDHIQVPNDHQVPAVIYVEMLEKNYHFGTAVQIVWGNHDQVYLADPAVVADSPAFKEWLADKNYPKICFDAKRTKVILHNLGLEFAGVVDDVLIASYLINAKDLSDDVADVAHEFGFDAIAYDETIYGKGAKKAIPEDSEKMYDHLARKLAVIDQLNPVLHDRLQADDMVSLYQDMELPLALVLANMELRGIKVNENCLADMQIEFAEIISKLEAKIYQEAGQDFNINSPKQLGKILFEDMGLPVIKKTKTGYSTAQDVLEKLRDQAPIADLILQYRQLAKLQSTYIEGLVPYIKADGKIHTRFSQTLTTTGRLSSADPNLQNIPIRTEEGRRIRQAFEPAQSGWSLLSADYSQIELRVLAHIAQDEHMIAAFKEGKDIHRATAAKVFGVAEDQVTANMRRDAKAVNFGIVYGISDYGLSQNLNISRQAARDFIDTYYQEFPNIKKYMDDIVASAREQGYVETLFKRRRYLPDIKARNFNLRSFAERTAMNTPIQGTAADIIKLAMVAMDQALITSHLQARLLLQVHDELIFEVPDDQLNDLADLVKQVMEDVVVLSVPLEADVASGKTWYDAK